MKKKRKITLISRIKGILTPLIVIIIAIGFTAVVRAHGGDSSLIHTCIGDNNGRTDIVGINDTCGTGETALDWVKNVFAGTGLTENRDSTGVTISADTTYLQRRVSSTCSVGSAIRAINSDGTVTCETAADISSGWTAANETWTYASSDDPTFTFTISGDKTDKYSAGMRIKLTQTTAKYFLITGVSYSSPNTTITVYGGTDYDLANATITGPSFSSAKAPQGFPLDPNKWTVEVTDSGDRIVNSPSKATWYNPDSALQISIPIGIWNVEYHARSNASALGATYAYSRITLSTSNNSESDPDLTGITGLDVSSGNIQSYTGQYRRKIISLPSKTTYYLNVWGDTNVSSLDVIRIKGNDSKTIIRAISAYL